MIFSLYNLPHLQVTAIIDNGYLLSDALYCSLVKIRLNQHGIINFFSVISILILVILACVYRKKWSGFCRKIVPSWSNYQLSRWCYRCIWEMFTRSRTDDKAQYATFGT